MTQRTLDLKTWPEPFAAVRQDRKPFEIRWDDRDYQVGDVLNLREYDPVKGAHTGEVERRRVTFILRGDDAQRFGLMPGYVAMGMERMPDEKVWAADPAALRPAQLLAWHEDNARRAIQRADNWRRSAAAQVRTGASIAVSRHEACADAADLEAGFHAKAALLVRGLIKPQVVTGA